MDRNNKHIRRLYERAPHLNKGLIMSNAWETTEEDILNVIHNMGKKASEDKVQEILDNLDQFKIEDAALNGDSIDEQTQYAYEEMKKQITEGNLI